MQRAAGDAGRSPNFSETKIFSAAPFSPLRGNNRQSTGPRLSLENAFALKSSAHAEYVGVVPLAHIAERTIYSGAVMDPINEFEVRKLFELERNLRAWPKKS